MPAGNSTTSWGWVSRLLHWAVAALILYQLGLGVYMVNFVTDLGRQFDLTQLHKSWGFVVFVLAVIRVAWRLAQPAHPALPPGMPRWQVRAAEISHVLLYLLIFVMPLSGWVMVSASPVQDLLQIQNLVFGLFPLPDPFVPGIEAVETVARRIHIASAILLALILAVHAAAALKHQLIDHDDVLRRMTFGK